MRKCNITIIYTFYCKIKHAFIFLVFWQLSLSETLGNIKKTLPVGSLPCLYCELYRPTVYTYRY